MRNLRKRLLLAWWAFRNPDSLTMLKHDLGRDSLQRNSNGGIPLDAHRAWWYLRYLTFNVKG
jgi:hypothetical protein